MKKREKREARREGGRETYPEQSDPKPEGKQSTGEWSRRSVGVRKGVEKQKEGGRKFDQGVSPGRAVGGWHERRRGGRRGNTKPLVLRQYVETEPAVGGPKDL